ncbi:MAG: preprotein translocase subunit YajC [Bacteroidetes bacterium GWF2_49_14]|nr:MAG: preprotein translocase subunit YajC [Bacteroidetes bacterium GWF2_49_14]HBB93611.1 preprotein translocase subunit YajC [Bacteroidales bacterium]
MYTLAFLFQTTAAKQPSPYSSLIFFAAIIVIFYFFMIRPQMKKQKELKNYREALKKGDKVVTAGGIYGRISEINERTILLEIDQNVRVKVDKGSIVRTAEDIPDQPKQ